MIDEERVENAEIPAERDEAPQIEKEDAPKDVRGAIKAAFKELNSDAEPDKSRDNEVDERPVRKARSKVQESATDSEDKPSKTNPGLEAIRAKREAAKEQVQEGNEQQVSDQKVEEKGLDPPPYYRVKGKGAWDKLDNESRKLLVAREQEISNGFGQISQRLKNAEDIERAIAPRLEAIQRFGVTPAQTVDRLFQWMEALSGPNKLHSFKELAKSFGVDVSQLISPQQGAEPTEQPQDQGPPHWFAEFTSKVDQELGGLKNQFRSQQEEAAFTFVKNWAKDKPFYQKVGPLMQQLIAAGVVGTTQDGIVDLDSAYEKACKLDPEVQALLQQEQDQKTAKAAADKAAREAKDRADKLARAKRAGAGLKPAVATTPAAPISGKPNGAGRTSVRDSIKAALDDLRE